jgi:hypothetical protein
MAAITSISVVETGDASAALTTLTADDTITFNAAKKQLLVLRNPTGGGLTATIDGDGGTSVVKPGVGTVTVSGGYAITVGAGLSRYIVLKAISDYCQGVVHITGASGMIVQLFDI